MSQISSLITPEMKAQKCITLGVIIAQYYYQVGKCGVALFPALSHESKSEGIKAGMRE